MLLQYVYVCMQYEMYDIIYHSVAVHAIVRRAQH